MGNQKKKTPNKKTSTQVKKSVERQVRKKGKKAAKKAVKNRKVAVALIVIVILLVAAIVITYVVKPELFAPIFDLLGIGSSGGDHGGDNGGENGGGDSIDGITPINGDKLEMTVLDVGQGDCIYIDFPDGQNMIVDIGSSGSSRVWEALGEFLDARNVTAIDYLFITHTDKDHHAGAPKLLEDYEVKTIYLPRVVNAEAFGSMWAKFYRLAQQETYTENGKTLDSEILMPVGTYEISGSGWQMQCYTYDEADYPSDEEQLRNAHAKNSVSPINVLSYGGRKIVLTGDSNDENEPYLIRKGYFDALDADVLKVAHHGAESSTCQTFLDKIDAEYALISAGEGNSYKHPHTALLNRLTDYRDLKPDDDYDGFAQIYDTIQDGNITVQVGENGVLNLVSEKKSERNRTTGEPQAKQNVNVLIVQTLYYKSQRWAA